MIMSIPGAVAPVVFGGKIRAVMAYLDRQKMQARGFSPLDVMNALDASNVFLPSGDGKFGDLDYVLDSNSMYENIADMGDIPLRYENGRAVYLRDVATPTDANYIQTNVVRVDGKREVYIPVYRQLGASTLSVVSKLWAARSRTFEERLTRSGISLKLVMDQSVYVRSSIKALVQEGVLGAILCSLVILLFLGEMRMTAIAIMTLPISIMACSAALYFTGQTINVMTLAGMTLAIGPMIDSAIICLENTHRHLGLGATPHEAAVSGCQRSRHARAGLDALHLPGARALGVHAGTGAVPVQADGDGRGVFDDRRLHSVADAGARLQRVLAERSRRTHGEPRRRPLARQWPRP